MDPYASDLERHDASRPRGKQVRLGPSNIGTCLRQDAFKQFGVAKSDEQDRGKARFGTLLHLGHAALAESEGRSAEVTIPIPGLGDGHADDVDYEHRVVTDLKTCNDRAFWSYLTNGLPESYWQQVELYAYGLICIEESENPQVDTENPLRPWTISVLLVNRETGQDERFEREADPQEGAYLADILAQRQHLLDTVRSPFEIAREGGGPGTGMPCDYCDWMTECWGPPVGDLSPQAASIVDDPEAIAAVLQDYLAASAEASKLEKAKKEARAFLEGIPPGDYGDATLKWQGGNDLGDEEDGQAAAAILRDMGVTVPTRRKVSARSIRVVRRAKGGASTSASVAKVAATGVAALPDGGAPGSVSTVISAGPDGE